MPDHTNENDRKGKNHLLPAWIRGNKDTLFPMLSLSGLFFHSETVNVEAQGEKE
jgi:hypothetical protein